MFGCWLILCAVGIVTAGFPNLDEGLLDLLRKYGSKHSAQAQLVSSKYGLTILLPAEKGCDDDNCPLDVKVFDMPGDLISEEELIISEQPRKYTLKGVKLGTEYKVQLCHRLQQLCAWYSVNSDGSVKQMQTLEEKQIANAVLDKSGLKLFLQKDVSCGKECKFMVELWDEHGTLIEVLKRISPEAGDRVVELAQVRRGRAFRVRVCRQSMQAAHSKCKLVAIDADGQIRTLHENSLSANLIDEKQISTAVLDERGLMVFLQDDVSCGKNCNFTIELWDENGKLIEVLKRICPEAGDRVVELAQVRRGRAFRVRVCRQSMQAAHSKCKLVTVDADGQIRTLHENSLSTNLIDEKQISTAVLDERGLMVFLQDDMSYGKNCNFTIELWDEHGKLIEVLKRISPEAGDRVVELAQVRRGRAFRVRVCCQSMQAAHSKCKLVAVDADGQIRTLHENSLSANLIDRKQVVNAVMGDKGLKLELLRADSCGSKCKFIVLVEDHTGEMVVEMKLVWPQSTNGVIKLPQIKTGLRFWVQVCRQYDNPHLRQCTTKLLTPEGNVAPAAVIETITDIPVTTPREGLPYKVYVSEDGLEMKLTSTDECFDRNCTVYVIVLDKHGNWVDYGSVPENIPGGRLEMAGVQSSQPYTIIVCREIDEIGDKCDVHEHVNGSTLSLTKKHDAEVQRELRFPLHIPKPIQDECADTGCLFLITMQDAHKHVDRIAIGLKGMDNLTVSLHYEPKPDQNYFISSCLVKMVEIMRCTFYKVTPNGGVVKLLPESSSEDD